MKKRMFGLLLATAVLLEPSQFFTPSQSYAEKPDKQITLAPEVEEFIKNTGMEHTVELPDPEEPLEVIKSYVQLKGSPDEVNSFKKLTNKYPNSRHAHNGLATAYYNQFTKTKNPNDAKQALKEELAAAKIARSHGNVFYIPWIKQMAIDAGQPEEAKKWFESILVSEPNNFLITFNYAELQKELGDQKQAEALYKIAQEIRPAGNIDAHAAYTEILLDQGRYEEAMKNSILVGERALYIDFLHGYALEKMGRGEEAVRFYKKFTEMSKSAPAPKRFQITDSPYQDENVNFSITTTTINSVLDNLSFVTACEALSEPTGAQREVAWTVRQRRNRGSNKVGGSTCLSVDNSGADMNTQYAHVICQGAPSGTGVSTAYAGVNCSSYNVVSCTNTNNPNTTTRQVAFDVEYGNVPDPFTSFCPAIGSTLSGTACSGTCNGGATDYGTWTYNTPHSFLASTYKPTKPFSCFSEASNVCGNGGSDNWFYYNGPSS